VVAGVVACTHAGCRTQITTACSSVSVQPSYNTADVRYIMSRSQHALVMYISQLCYSSGMRHDAEGRPQHDLLDNIHAQRCFVLYDVATARAEVLV
jgi:hypothetical protein